MHTVKQKSFITIDNVLAIWDELQEKEFWGLSYDDFEKAVEKVIPIYPPLNNGMGMTATVIENSERIN